MKHLNELVELFSFFEPNYFNSEVTHLKSDGNGNIVWEIEFNNKKPLDCIRTIVVHLPVNIYNHTTRIMIQFHTPINSDTIQKLLNSILKSNNLFEYYFYLKVKGRFYQIFELPSNISKNKLQALLSKNLILSLERHTYSKTSILTVFNEIFHLLHLLASDQDKTELWQMMELYSGDNTAKNYKTRKTTFLTHPRNSKLVEMLKKFYDYRCQLCGFSIIPPTGKPYVEVHHITPLFENGPDSVKNMLVVCPNCHKMLHLWHDVVCLSGFSS